jgi:hypothetical protein
VGFYLRVLVGHHQHILQIIIIKAQVGALPCSAGMRLVGRGRGSLVGI